MKQIIFFAFTLSGITVYGQHFADKIVGTWQTPGKEPARILISKSDNTYSGKIVWLQNPMDSDGTPKKDLHNPDIDKKELLILGSTILSGFTYDINESWVDGKIYDPDSGNTYKCVLKINEKGELKVRGYIGISVLGRTEIWTRYQ